MAEKKTALELMKEADALLRDHGYTSNVNPLSKKEDEITESFAHLHTQKGLYGRNGESRHRK